CWACGARGRVRCWKDPLPKRFLNTITSRTVWQLTKSSLNATASPCLCIINPRSISRFRISPVNVHLNLSNTNLTPLPTSPSQNEIRGSNYLSRNPADNRIQQEIIVASHRERLDDS